MSPLHRSVATSAAAWSRLEPLIEEFEEAWLGGSQPNLDDFLPADEAERATLLVELVHADLECRIKKGLAAHVETYVEKFPELAQAPTRVLELVETEFNLRRRREPNLSVDEFLERFPQFREQLASRLSSAPAVQPSLAPPQLGCPDCGTLIPLSGEPLSGELTCPNCQRTIRVDPSHGQAGRWPNLTRLGKFALEAVVGKGAFGTVYRAQDTELGRTVAVKVPRRPLTNAEEEGRFFREARLAAQLTHPGIVPVYDVSRADDCPYIVSGFVEGETLAETVKQRRLPFPRVAEVLADVADAVEYAHQHKVIHRDLKPSNIMLGRLVGSGNGAAAVQPAPVNEILPTTPLVMDFGLARGDEDEIRMTVDGQILGTPAYMSPEQATGQGHQADARSDVYSLGVILYELLTGEVPFRGVPHMVLSQIRLDEPRRPRALNDKIPRDLETIALKCLEKVPAKRYPTAAALAEEMRCVVYGKPIQARPIGKLERSWRWARRNRWQTAALGLLIFMAVGSTAAAFYIHGQRQIAIAARSAAEADKLLADERLDLTLETVGTLIFNVEDQLARKPMLADLRGSLLRTVKEGLDKVARTTQDQRVQWSEISVHERLGDIDFALGLNTDAQAHFRRAHDLAMTTHLADPENRRTRKALANTHKSLGKTSHRLGWNTESREHFEQALALARITAAETPERWLDSWQVVSILLELGDAQIGWGNQTAARQSLEEARNFAQRLADREPRSRLIAKDLATASLHLGKVQLHLKEFPAARENFLKAVEAAEKMIAQWPREGDAYGLMASAQAWLGDALLALGNLAGAEDCYRKALARHAEQRKVDPFRVGGEHTLALASARLGDVDAQRGNADAAVAHYEKAVALFDDYLLGTPRDARARRDWIGVQERFGLLFRRLGQLAKARELILKVYREREALARLDSKSYQPSLELTFGLANLALVELDRLDFPAAVRWHREAQRILQRLEKEELVPDRSLQENAVRYHQGRLELCEALPQSVESLEFTLVQKGPQVSELLYRRASVLAAHGKRDDAVATIEQVLRLKQKDHGFVADSGRLCSALLNNQEGETRQRYTQLALDLLADAIRLGYRDLAKLRSHPEWVALREEKRFQDLLIEVETLLKKPKPKPKPKS